MNKNDILPFGVLSAMVLSISVSYAQDTKKHTYDSFQIANGAYMDFKRIEPGTFVMGSQDKKRQEADGPPHEVTITKPFYIGKYEVTQSQWNHVMRKLTWNNPSSFGGRLSNPVESISWLEVQEFVAKINEFDGGKRYRLPTEAEWEYACRAGTTTRTYWGGDPDDKAAIWHAWLGGYPHGSTSPVGVKSPNAWGLYDMCGNVVELCQDSFAPYKEGHQTDPLNLVGKQVVGRGGDWFHAHGVDSETRRKHNKEGGLSFLGFRLVREISE
jgi:formylglycine-generating enzyme required for sulfatase activity